MGFVTSFVTSFKGFLRMEGPDGSDNHTNCRAWICTVRVFGFGQHNGKQGSLAVTAWGNALGCGGGDNRRRAWAFPM